MNKKRMRGLWSGLVRDVPSTRLFAAASLTPAVLLALSALKGGAWSGIALFYITIFTFIVDELAARAYPDAPEGREFPAADGLLATLALAHFGLLILGVAALIGATGISAPARVALFLALGLFMGQLSNSTAHELIHRADKRLFLLGMLVYISLLFGHHTSAHRLVHHRHVATPRDPNSARKGESFYRFFARAWVGSFRAGYEAEADLRARTTSLRGLRRINPYIWYLFGGFAYLILAGALAGAQGVLAYLALIAYAQIQLMLSDYVQHYGLTRAPRGEGYEPVSARHSWDAREPLSSLFMLNAPRHSDHHAHPNRPFPALRLVQEAEPRPMLPHSLPAMAALALFPPLWRRVMDKRLTKLGF